jgi:hypothetical protein
MDTPVGDAPHVVHANPVQYLPAPPLTILLTIDDALALDDKVDVSMTTGMRACACCGLVAFGLEAASRDYRCTPRILGVNDRAASLSPIIRDFGCKPQNTVPVC